MERIEEGRVGMDEVRGIISAWITEYLAKDHEAMPRPGAVCPFAKPALDAGTIEIRTVEVSGPCPASALVEQVRGALEEFAAAAALDRATAHGALVLAVPGLLETGYLIDEVHEQVKSEAVAMGLMIGQFHADCPEPSARNPLFAVNQSPIPLLAIRSMTVHDILFLGRDAEWFGAYEERFGQLYRMSRRIDPAFVALYEAARARFDDPAYLASAV